MTDRQLAELALDARKHAYVPYSNFKVGAALLCSDGTVFTGCNVENAAYGSTICAERTALVKAVSEGQRSFTAIAIAGSGDDFCWPCGSCRQMLFEFAPDLRVLAVRPDGQFQTTALTELLPHAFGPTALN
ncbi:MAG: cytidine deaminase [Oscillospiraceae bacterium]|nr:cytidine deaminase [Oscillospiraceae bacterium]